MRRTAKIALYFLGLVFLILLIAVVWLLKNKPDYSGSAALPGFSDSTVVYFDEFGIPHIYGSNEEDVFRALGYLQAQDRLFQMEMIRRASGGNLSEVLGSNLVEVDRYFRMLGFNRKAEEAAAAFEKNSAEKWNKTARAYLEGINAYIKNGRKPLDLVLLGIPQKEFTVKDMYLIVCYMTYNFQMAFRTDPLLARIEKEFGSEYVESLTSAYGDSPVVSFDSVSDGNSHHALSHFSTWDALDKLLPFPVWQGSNSIVIGAKKSASGKVLFENDTHIGHQQPAVWFEAHLEYPGFSFYGSFLSGFPFAAMGHTNRHAWGLTIFENDDLDFFKETVHPSDSNKVLRKTKWESLSIREEVIKVKGSADHVFNVRTSSYGPVCSDVIKDFSGLDADAVSLCWTFLREPVNLMEVTYGMAHAKSFEEFRQATSTLIAPGLNVLYGDAENNIAWWAAGKIIKRPASAKSFSLLDGASGEHDWLGYYDFSKNPQAENPTSGFVFSANQQPDSIDGVLYDGYYLPDDRSLRIRELILLDSLLNSDDLKRIVSDIVNPRAKQICQLLLDYVPPPSDRDLPFVQNVYDELSNWEGSHQLADKAPVLYYIFLYKVLQSGLGDELGNQGLYTFLKTHVQKNSVIPLLKDSLSPWWDNTTTPTIRENAGDIVRGAYASMLEAIEQKIGTDPLAWAWNKWHTLEYNHPLGAKKPLDRIFNIGPFPIAGGLETVNNQSFQLTDTLPFKTNLGPALRRVVDFADPENSWSISPSGQSGRILSPHYQDQAEMYTKEEFRKEKMNRKEIQSTARYKFVFLPLK